MKLTAKGVWISLGVAAVLLIGGCLNADNNRAQDRQLREQFDRNTYCEFENRGDPDC